MMKRVLVAAALLALVGPALARPAHHRFSHRRPAEGRGMPITEGASNVRINAVGEVIAPKIGKITVDGK